VPRPLDMAGSPASGAVHYYAFDMWPYDFDFTRAYTLTLDLPVMETERYTPEHLRLYAYTGSTWTLVPGTYAEDRLTAVISTTLNTTTIWSLMLPVEPKLFLPITRRP